MSHEEHVSEVRLEEEDWGACGRGQEVGTSFLSWGKRDLASCGPGFLYPQGILSPELKGAGLPSAFPHKYDLPLGTVFGRGLNLRF